MSSPADENTNVVPVKPKKPRPRTKQKINPDTDKRFKKNGQRTEAQQASQFKPGNAEGKIPVKKNNAKKNREFREKCRKILEEAALPMLVNRLYDSHEDLETKHFIELLKYLTLYAIGKPAEMETEDVQDTSANIVNNIVISQEMLNNALHNDNEHLVITETSVPNG